MGKNPSQKEILQPIFAHSYLSVPNPTTSIHSSRTASTSVFFYIPKVSTPHELSFLDLNSLIQSLHMDKSIVDRKHDEGQYFLGIYICLCSNMYYSILTLFFLFSDNLNKFPSRDTISYTTLHSNITNFSTYPP